MKSWRTTLAGAGAALAAVAGILTLLGNTEGSVDWNQLGPLIAALVASIANAIGNFAARDNVVSSQDVRPVPKTPPLVADAIRRAQAPQ
jgi:hypothetical protein